MTYSFLKDPLLFPCQHLLDLDFDMDIIKGKKNQYFIQWKLSLLYCHALEIEIKKSQEKGANLTVGPTIVISRLSNLTKTVTTFI